MFDDSSITMITIVFIYLYYNNDEVFGFIKQLTSPIL